MESKKKYVQKVHILCEDEKEIEKYVPTFF
jgi:hypothetical protein